MPDDHPMAGLLTVMMNRDVEARWTMPRVRDELARIARGQRSTVVPAPAPAPTREVTGVLPPVQAGPPAAPAPRHGARWGWLAAVAVLAVAAVVAAYVWAGRGTPEALPDEQQTRSAETSAAETTTGSTAPPVTAEDTRAQMDAFITSYLATVTSDPRAAFDRLTPEFQQASGGYEGYMGWWGRVQSASLAEVASDPSDLTVGYTVDYVMRTGERNTERVRLQLERFDDKLLIAGEG